MSNQKKSNSNAVLVGKGIGDALGMQFETKPWNSNQIMAWDGSFGSSEFHKLGPGQWTDDTGMALALSKTLLSFNGEFYPEAVIQEYLAWMRGPDFRGAGQTTKDSLERAKTTPWYFSGKLGALGNGTSMRAAPLGIAYRNDPDKLIKAAKLDAIMTHNSHDAQQGSIAMAMGVAHLLNGVSKQEILESVKRVLEPSAVLTNLEQITKNQLIHKTLTRDSKHLERDRNGGNRIISQLILGNKYTVVEAVARAFYVLVATDSFLEAVELAVRGGGDTDTAAAMVGALAGAHYGLENIPAYHKENVERFDLLVEIGTKLDDRNSSRI